MPQAIREDANESSTRQRRKRSWKIRLGLSSSPRIQEEPSSLDDAALWARRLTAAADLLLDRLLAHLSSSSTSSPSNSCGMTLPLSAVAWLSSQYFPESTFDRRKENQEGDDRVEFCPTVWTLERQAEKVQALKRLLPQISHLRIVHSIPWPPKEDVLALSSNPETLVLPVHERGSGDLTDQGHNRPISSPPDEVNCSMLSVGSGLTADEAHTAAQSASGLPTRRIPTREAFIHFFRTLQDKPTVDLRFVPRLQLLVLEQVSPADSISYLHSLQNHLQLLKWTRTDFSSTPLSQIFLKRNNKHQINSNLYASLTHLDLSRCTWNHDNDDSLSRSILKAMPRLQHLSLAYVGLTSQESLRGLEACPELRALNLSHNSLTTLDQIHTFCGGQLQKLVLSFNALTSVQGIDRLFSLEVLCLDHNALKDLSEMATLCRLPFLQDLNLQSQSSSFETEFPLWRKQLWEWCMQYRNIDRIHDMPRWNQQSIRIDQWNALVREVVPIATPHITTSTFLPVQRKQPRTQQQTIRKYRPPTVGTSQIRTNQRRITDRGRARMATKGKKQCQKKPCNGRSSSRSVTFSVQDVLISLHSAETDEFVPKTTKSPKAGNGKAPSEELVDETPEKTTKDGDDDDSDLSFCPYYYPDDPARLLPLEPIDFENDGIASEENQAQAEETSPKFGTISVTSKEAFFAGSDTGPMRSRTSTEGTATVTPIASNGGKAILDLALVGQELFDVMSADWEALVQLAAGGLIPDGKPRMPVPVLKIPEGGDTPFSKAAADLLSSEEAAFATKVSSPVKGSFLGDRGAEDQFTISSSYGLRSNALPEQIYSDDFSVPSSLGTNREDFPSKRVKSKYQIAEENATFDGPELYSKRTVLENLQEYFKVYVFPNSIRPFVKLQSDDEGEEDEEVGWKMVAQRYPRVQLYSEDWKIVEAQYAASSSAPVVSPTGSTSLLDSNAWDEDSEIREQFVRLWAEDVIPCGKAALRRLMPNRRNRLSFHGDQLFLSGGGPDPYAECRKVYLCLSSSAFYIIIRGDEVIKKLDERGIKKRFPNPLPDGSTFQDSPWPHAVARHTFQDLQTITIGFEFQRLTLQFRNPNSKKTTDPFVYVLLTSNKKETVRLLQEIQKLANEVKRDAIELNSDAAPVTIENDSQLVMDSLQAALAPEVAGTILHYQLVQQRWRRGERGTVRRACFVTDTKLYLMDEDYHADSHQPLEPPAIGIDAVKKSYGPVTDANVSYRRVDEAHLRQVVEVQAAGADPKAITIVIKPDGRLSRTHNWRLICRDNIGAERLVEDVRKAIAIMAKG